jgi:hypothetical protein
MSLIKTIQLLNTDLRHQEEEYEYTSDFLEWFYYNIYREQGFNNYPILYSVSEEPEYKIMRSLCYFLINLQYTHIFNNETRIKLYEAMKEWTIASIAKNNELY